MSKVNTKIISLVGCAATFVAFSMAGCAGSKTEDGGNGGDSSVGGTGNEGGSTSNAGGSTGNVGGSTGNTGGKTSASSTIPVPEGVTCGPTTAPGNPLLTDFSDVAAGAYNANFNWGDSKKTLTGGTFFYDGDGDDTVAVLTVTVADAKATITGTIPATEYAGFGFWFGPCTDARAYKGLSFKMSGDMGNSQLQIQMQSSRNYPIDTKNQKGECEGTWSDGCASNSKTFSNLALTAELQAIEIPWADLTGGAPIDPLEPAELLGFQWHFNCGETECTPNVVIDDVTFY